MKWVVQRRSSDPEAVTGELLIDGQHECWTLEPPYGPASVKPRAIPAGSYPLTVRFSLEHQRLLPHVEDVPGFEEVEIHVGNFPKDTKGCTLVGTVQGKDFILRSAEEFERLFQKIQDAVSAEAQHISYLDPAPPTRSDVDGEISV